MAVDAATINAKGEAAVTAIGAGDWATAKTRLTEMAALLAAIPNSRIEGGMELEWDREAIERLLKRVDRDGVVARVASLNEHLGWNIMRGARGRRAAGG